MAKNMSFWLRWGNSCGIPFYKDKFCSENRVWAYLRPYLHDRPQQPWTKFNINTKHSSKTKRNKQNRKRKSKRNKK